MSSVVEVKLKKVILTLENCTQKECGCLENLKAIKRHAEDGEFIDGAIHYAMHRRCHRPLPSISKSLYGSIKRRLSLGAKLFIFGLFASLLTSLYLLWDALS